MKTLRWNLLGLMLCALPIWISAQEVAPAKSAKLAGAEAQALWEQANEAYRQEDYTQALELYQQLVEGGIELGPVHYNLGNAYFRNQQLGMALLHYYKARDLMPGDPDVQANLDLANQTRVDPLIDEENDALHRGFHSLMRQLPYHLVFHAAWLLFAVAALAGMFKLLKPQSGKWVGYVLVIAATLGLMATAAGFVQHRELTRRDYAVVIQPEIQVKAGPSASESINFTIHEGIRCQILDRVTGWVRIRLANGYNGWVPTAAVAQI